MPNTRVTRIAREVIAAGTPNTRVTRIGREVIAAGTPNTRVTRLGREVIADPGNLADFLSDETFFTPQAVYTQTFTPPLLTDEALFTPSWTQFFTPPLIDDGALFYPVIPRSIQQSIFT